MDTDNLDQQETDNQDQQTQTDDWKAGLPEDMRASPQLEKFTTIEGLAKSYINAEAMIGKDKIVMPTTDDEYMDVYDKLGRPESIDSYEFTAPEDMPENFQRDENMEAGFKQKAHELGLNNKQFSGFMDWFYDYMKESGNTALSEMQSAHEDGLAKLKQEWGQNTEGNLAMVNRAIEDLAGDELAIKIGNTLGNDPDFAKFMHGLITKSGEAADYISGNGQSGDTPDMIKSQISDAMASTAYQNAGDPGHSAAVRKVQNLYTKLHATTS